MIDDLRDTGDMDLIHHEVSGRADGPVIVFGHALGTDLGMWQPQVDALAAEFRLVRVDFRGHGRSRSGPIRYPFDTFADDVARVIRAGRYGRVHYVGSSLGGVVGLKLALRHPDLLASLFLACTRCRADTPARAYAVARRETVARDGIEAIVESTITHWFTAASRTELAAYIEAVKRSLSRVQPEVYGMILEELAGFDMIDALSGIRVPTLIAGGRHDPAGDAVSLIHRHVAHSRLVWFEQSAHFPNIEQCRQFNEVLASHVASVSTA